MADKSKVKLRLVNFNHYESLNLIGPLTRGYSR